MSSVSSLSGKGGKGEKEGPNFNILTEKRGQLSPQVTANKGPGRNVSGATTPEGKERVVASYHSKEGGVRQKAPPPNSHPQN